MVIGKNDKLNLGGSYLDFPGYGKPGHFTVSQFYNSLLQSIGKRQEMFGFLDPDLDKHTQTGPLQAVMA